MLAVTIGGTRQALAQTGLRDTVHVVLVGRTESSDVYLDFPAADTLRGNWAKTATPSPLTRAGPIYLRTVLPITIGTSEIGPGRYQLWTVGTVGGADLILSAPQDSGTDASSVLRERARAPLQVIQSPSMAFITKAAIKTTSRGPDTLVIADRSTTHMDIGAALIHPGTSSLLVIWIGDAELTVPISAR